MKVRLISKVCFLLIAGALTATSPVASAPITRQKALENVCEFLKERGVDVKKKALRHAPLKSNGYAQETAPYYVFNLDDDNGFVIASGDDCANAILGYSDKGSFDTDNIPMNVQAWLDGYADEIEWGRENHVKALNSTEKGQTKVSVNPLLKSKWGQGSPYNDQCVFDGVALPTGCGATAMAQLMYYWATIGKDGKTFRCGSIGMSPYITTNKYQVDSIPPLDSFDWENMTDEKPTTSIGKKAVAQLMRYCGQSLKMDYSSSGSGSNSGSVSPALINKFGYSWNMQTIFASSMTSEEWDSLIYDNIAKGLPVFMVGTGTGGHGFLCDGYDFLLDKYHFNWGWDGNFDGHYAMSALNPGLNNFSYNKMAIIDILPFGNCAYAILSPDSTILRVYSDTKKDQREGIFYKMSINDFSIKKEARGKLEEIIFDPSCVDYHPTGWLLSFCQLPNLKKIIGLEYFNTSRVTNMSRMFEGCSSLESLDISHFDMRNVTNMSSMFYDCNSLKSLDLGFNTSNVTTMSSMFSGCSSLESLDISHFDTQNVTNMSYMFYGCNSLKSLDLGFNTSNVTNMSRMFSGCSSLECLDIRLFDTQNVTNMSYMFYGCNSLKSLDLGFNTSNVTNMSRMFSGCSSLESLDISHFDMRNVTDMSYMFYGCNSLKSLDLGFNTSNVTTMSSMFSGCSSLESLDLGFNTSNVTTMSSMFSGCSSLESLDISHFDTQNVTSMYNMFSSCNSLKSLDLSNFNTQNVLSIERMFNYCSSLEGLDMSNFDIQNVVNSEYFLNGCNSLKKLILSASMEKLNDNACVWVRNQSFPCRICVPNGFNFGVDTSKLVFSWKGGFFFLGESIPGDVNYDDRVDISDVTMTVSYILGNKLAFFNKAAADIDSDGEINVSDLVNIVNIVLSPNEEKKAFRYCPDDHHPHMIDLGLPSGTLWSCCNIDADNPQDAGGYYAWGECEEKEYYDWNTYIHCDGTEETYHDIGSDIADTEYDVAHVKWGDGWQMPTEEQFQEFIDYTSSRSVVNGHIYVGANGGFVFFPEVKYKYREKLVDSLSPYWTSTRYGNITARFFGSSWGRLGPISFEVGCPVRPVHK